MTAPKQSPLVEVVAQALCGVLDVQPGKSHPLPVIYEAAQAAIAACHAEEMRFMLARLVSSSRCAPFPHQTLVDDIDESAALLTKLNGQS